MTERVHKYMVASGAGAGIIDEVNRLIERGWQPLGGIYSGTHYFYQAMVLYHGTEETS